MSLKLIDAPTLNQWLKSGEAVLLDVREPAEFSAEHIEGATLVPLGKVCAAAIPTLGAKKLVIHCRKGGRGGSACQKLLSENPALDIYNLDGGIEAWANAGFAVARGGRNMLPLDRQVQLTIGLLLLIITAAAYLLNPQLILLAGFIGAGLTVAGLTGFCGLARLIARMPWNQRTT
jgi:rhodanese-related sulfurtransferase